MTGDGIKVPRQTSSIWRWIASGDGREVKPHPRALADLERRKALGDRPDLTGRMLGDPPPGRSALDRKRAAEEAERLARLARAATETEQRDSEEKADG